MKAEGRGKEKKKECCGAGVGVEGRGKRCSALRILGHVCSPGARPARRFDDGGECFIDMHIDDSGDNQPTAFNLPGGNAPVLHAIRTGLVAQGSPDRHDGKLAMKLYTSLPSRPVDYPGIAPLWALSAAPSPLDGDECGLATAASTPFCNPHARASA